MERIDVKSRGSCCLEKIYRIVRCKFFSLVCYMQASSSFLFLSPLNVKGCQLILQHSDGLKTIPFLGFCEIFKT